MCQSKKKRKHSSINRVPHSHDSSHTYCRWDCLCVPACKQQQQEVLLSHSPVTWPASPPPCRWGCWCCGPMCWCTGVWASQRSSWENAGERPSGERHKNFTLTWMASLAHVHTVGPCGSGALVWTGRASVFTSTHYYCQATWPDSCVTSKKRWCFTRGLETWPASGPRKSHLALHIHTGGAQIGPFKALPPSPKVTL